MWRNTCCLSALSDLSCGDVPDWRCFLAHHSVNVCVQVGHHSCLRLHNESYWMNHSRVWHDDAPPTWIHSTYPRLYQSIRVWMKERCCMSKTCAEKMSLRNKSSKFDICDLTHLSCTDDAFLLYMQYATIFYWVGHLNTGKSGLCRLSFKHSWTGKPNFMFHISWIDMHTWIRCTAQTRPMTAVSHGKMGIMLSSSGPKNKSYQLTYESTVIQPRNIERLFMGGELHVLGWSEESTATAPGDGFVPLLAVSDNLQD